MVYTYILKRVLHRERKRESKREKDRELVLEGESAFDGESGCWKLGCGDKTKNQIQIFIKFIVIKITSGAGVVAQV